MTAPAYAPVSSGIHSSTGSSEVLFEAGEGLADPPRHTGFQSSPPGYSTLVSSFDSDSEDDETSTVYDSADEGIRPTGPLGQRAGRGGAPRYAALGTGDDREIALEDDADVLESDFQLENREGRDSATTEPRNGTSGQRATARAWEWLKSRVPVLRIGQRNGTQGRTVYVGRGVENDGVFNNLMAKPESSSEQRNNEEQPPSYEDAAADATPPYWEATVFTPGFNDEVYVDGLPVGSVVNFVWNLMVSYAFQLVGFFLTYLLHTSHAAKNGSRAGLGFTSIQFGYSLLPEGVFSSDYNKPAHVDQDYFQPSNPSDFDVYSANDAYSGTVDSNMHHQASDGTDAYISENDGSVTMGWLFVGFGGLLILISLIDYIRAIRMEMIILRTPTVVEVGPSNDEQSDQV